MLLRDIYDIVQQFGNNKVKLLKEYHRAAGQVASGKTLESFRSETSIEATDISLKIYGAEHIEYLDRGRGIGDPSPIQDLLDWINNKPGLTGVETESQKLSFACAISKKHQKKGSYQHRTGKTYKGFEKPVSSAVTMQDNDKLQKEIIRATIKSINSEVLEMFRNRSIS